MAELQDLKKCFETIDWENSNIRRLKWRLDIVYQYKLYFDRAANFTREQLDFINQLLNPGRMRLLACWYCLAITDAIELIESSERCIRSERLSVELANRVHIAEHRPHAGERRQRNRRDAATSAVVRRVLKLQRGVGRPATKSFLLRQSYSMALVETILALSAERRAWRRRQNR